MDNISDSLHVDYVARSSSSTNTAPPNNAGATSALSASERSKIRRLIPLVNLPRTRSQAITQLYNIFKANKAGGPELGLMLWESRGTMFSLLEELMSAYRLLHPPRLTMNYTKKVCNVLVLIQCIALLPEKRVDLLNAQIPTYFYPYMTTESPVSQYDYLQLSGLGVIGALVKETVPDTPNVVRYLLQAETIPVCLRCMEMGGDFTKSVATLILGRIFSLEEGKAYIGSFVERFYVLTKALEKVVDEFTGIPPPALLRNILICYQRLSEVSRLCRCSDTLKRCYPMQLRHPAYLNYICDGTPEVWLIRSYKILTRDLKFNMKDWKMFAGMRILYRALALHAKVKSRDSSFSCHLRYVSSGFPFVYLFIVMTMSYGCCLFLNVLN